MSIALTISSIALAAELYVPSDAEVEAYEQAVTSSAEVDQVNRMNAPVAPSMSNHLRGIAMGMRVLDLSDDDTAQILLAVNRFAEMERKTARQIQSQVCKRLDGVTDVRTVNPDDIVQIFDSQAAKIEEAAQTQYDKLMGKLSSKGTTTVSTFLSENLNASSSTSMAEAFARAGSPVVPIFLMLERCQRIAGPSTEESNITGVTK